MIYNSIFISRGRWRRSSYHSSILLSYTSIPLRQLPRGLLRRITLIHNATDDSNLQLKSAWFLRERASAVQRTKTKDVMQNLGFSHLYVWRISVLWCWLYSSGLWLQNLKPYRNYTPLKTLFDGDENGEKDSNENKISALSDINKCALQTNNFTLPRCSRWKTALWRHNDGTSRLVTASRCHVVTAGRRWSKGMKRSQKCR